MLEQLITTVVVISALFGVVLLGGPTASEAVHTGRWVGYSVVYDKVATPI